jgi:hypothetical protein
MYFYAAQHMNTASHKAPVEIQAQITLEEGLIGESLPKKILLGQFS